MTPEIEIQEFDRHFVAGEKPAPLVISFKDSDGNALDISSGYTAKFVIVNLDGSVQPEENAASVSDGAAGEVTYTWEADDLLTPGTYQGQAWVGNLTNRFASIRYQWVVDPALSTPPSI